MAPRDPFCSTGFCLIAKGILLGNVISLSLGDLNAIAGGAGLKRMSPSGLENWARIKKRGNNGRKSGRTTPSNQKERGRWNQTHYMYLATKVAKGAGRVP